MKHRLRFFGLMSAALLALAAVGTASAAHYDPPGRVARVSDLRGSVSFSPAGESDWLRATRNRPLVSGDRLWTDRRGRVEVQVGSAAWRLGEYSSFEILNLDDQNGQVQLTQGTLNLNVRRLYREQTYEVATPTLAFVISEPGSYRIDVDPDASSTTVVVWEGSGTAYGDRANFSLREGDAIRFYDTALNDYEEFGLPGLDNFDRYCLARDERMYQSASLRYVSEDIIGYSDLDEYGSWRPVRDYGTVWFPTRVSVGWAPYREGHWVWQEPWGWTWIDDAPWGFAPSHYGRWAHIGGNWGWIPGPRRERAFYAPALVAFVGGHNWNLSLNLGGASPIGWFPLGPREVYVPSYQVSRNYFTQINITNTVINTTNITNIYNNYSSGGNLTQVNYANRFVQNAVTAVPSDVFVNAKPVAAANLRPGRNAVNNFDVMPVAAVAPSARSIAGAVAAADSKPAREVFERRVVAVQTPAPEPAPFAARQRQLQKDPGKPLTEAQAEAVRPRGRDSAAQSVRVLDEQPRGNVREPAGPRSDPTSRKPLDRETESSGPRQPSERGRQPENAVERQREPLPRDRTVKDPGQGQVERERREQDEAARRADAERQSERRRVETERGAELERERQQGARDQQLERQRQADAAQQEEVRRQRQVERSQQDEQRRQQAERERQQTEQHQRQAEREQQAEQQRREMERSQQAEQRQREAEREYQAEQRRQQSERAQQAEQQRREMERSQQAEQRQRQAEREYQAEQQRQQSERAQQAEQQRREMERSQQQQAEQQRRQAEQAQQYEQQRRQAEQAQQYEQQRRHAEQAQQAEQQRRSEESEENERKDSNAEEGEEKERRRQR